MLFKITKNRLSIGPDSHTLETDKQAESDILTTRSTTSSGGGKPSIYTFFDKDKGEFQIDAFLSRRKLDKNSALPSTSLVRPLKGCGYYAELLSYFKPLIYGIIS